MTFPTVIADPLAALVSWANGELDAPVYGDRLPGSQTGQTPTAGLVLRHAGGPARTGQLALVVMRLDAHAFASTPYNAAQVHWRWHEVANDLQRVVSGDVLLHSLTLESGPFTVTDPETEWPELASSWLLRASEKVSP